MTIDATPGVSPTTAHLLETAEIAFITAQIHGAHQGFPMLDFRAEAVGGGVVAVTKAAFGRKLNHVAGFAMNGPVTGRDLETIESLFKPINVPPEINLCPFAHPSARELFNSRGYKICGQMSVWALSLRDYKVDDEHAVADAIVITTVDKEEDRNLFIKSSIDGFRQENQSVDLFHTLAATAVRRPDTRLYFAKVNGEIAATAGLASITTSLGRVAVLYIDSTVPKFRGMGIQTMLLKARLAEAKKAGFEIATVTTWPEGTSARNMRRVGFELAFKKDIFTLVD